MYGSPARMRVEQQATRRGSGMVVVSTVLSLLVVVAAVAVVAYLVMRAPAEGVDSAERLEPVGTALPAPSEQPTLPTPIPTAEPEPTALGFTGDAPEAPAVSGLPTVAAPQEAGPTPTPRVVALPTAPPLQPTPVPTPPPPPPTLPPSVPVDTVPVVALEPVESAPAAPTTAPVDAEDEREPAPEPEERDDDPFNIFGDDEGDGSRIAPAQNEALERALAIQDDAAGNAGDEGRDREDRDPLVMPTFEVPEIVPAAGESPIVNRRDGNLEIVVPDVDAMIDEITAQVTDPNRNPNVGDAGRGNDGRDLNRIDERDDDNDDRDGSSSDDRRRSARGRDNDRNNRQSENDRGRSSSNDNVPAISNSGSNDDDRDRGDCRNPFENIPEDMRPEGFPFDDC